MAVRSDLTTPAKHETCYVRKTNAGLPLVDHKENSQPAFPLILTLLEKQDRYFTMMFTCWSIVTNWIHYISSFSQSFIYTPVLIFGTHKCGVFI